VRVANIDGHSRRLSALGDSRERTVPCQTLGCGRRTIALDAVCDACHEREVA
jgi:hypothetical protein